MSGNLEADFSGDAVPLKEAALASLIRNFHSRMNRDDLIEEESGADHCRTLWKYFSESSQKKQDNSPVILCIGTDRLIGDSLGPVVGSLLVRSGCPFPVYGTLASPVHALNLREQRDRIRSEHPASPVIAIDASLGPGCRIGCVSLRPHGLRPGSGVDKELGYTGDISITGITNEESLHPYLALQTARLSTVMCMAEEICTCILGIA